MSDDRRGLPPGSVDKSDVSETGSLPTLQHPVSTLLPIMAVCPPPLHGICDAGPQVEGPSTENRRFSSQGVWLCRGL